MPTPTPLACYRPRFTWCATSQLNVYVFPKCLKFNIEVNIASGSTKRQCKSKKKGEKFHGVDSLPEIGININSNEVRRSFSSFEQWITLSFALVLFVISLADIG
jgi:hypothetical protein